MEINFSSHISLKEYYKYSIHAYINKPIVIYACIVILLPGLLGLASTGTELFVGPGFYFLGLVLFFLLLPGIMYFSVRNIYKTNPYLKEVQEYSINEDTISIRSESHAATIKWSAIYKMKETGSFLIIYTSMHTVLLLPKKSIGDLSRIQQLKKWAARYIPYRKSANDLFKTKLFYISIGLLIAFLFLFSHEKTLSDPADKGKMFYEVLASSVSTLMGFMLMGAAVACVIALIPRKEMTYQVRFVQSFIWVCLVAFAIMDLILLIIVLASSNSW